MSFTSNLDNSITRCRYLQNVLHWLMLCTLQSLQRIKDVRQQQEYISIIDAASTAAQKISDNVTVQSLLYVAMSEDTEAVLNPANDVQPFVDQLRVIERLMKLSRPYLFCEMLRGCFMGLIDSCHGQEELKWAAFMYIKLPQIFMKIQQQAPGKDFDKDLEQGFDICDCFVCILNECKKLDMLSESQYQSLVQRRMKEHGKTGAMESSSTQASPSLIVKAIHTVTSILKKLQFPGGSSKDSVANTLDADYTKNQEAFLGVLCHMMNIKSFELILAAAAATGKLQIFATKLIKINEFAKQTVNETAKTAQSRSLLFDMSFLLLCHITQTYGFEIITSAPEYNETFFVQWMTRCMPEDGKYKCPDNMSPTDQSKVDILLNQLINGVEMKPR
ncbi:hypothetical protein KUTeg_008521 [Tegillarca granosa]|uniref:Mediator of RNA polymerase II transcription subunit 24 n=1 Tax=Tegillarca granosa TaxID=220873 RepID=A0ABQ9FCF7_TEGGR|nr:hypothetical protein KUTeg_008521 [Tegillarca granosa]